MLAGSKVFTGLEKAPGRPAAALVLPLGANRRPLDSSRRSGCQEPVSKELKLGNSSVAAKASARHLPTGVNDRLVARQPKQSQSWLSERRTQFQRQLPPPPLMAGCSVMNSSTHCSQSEYGSASKTCSLVAGSSIQSPRLSSRSS